MCFWRETNCRRMRNNFNKDMSVIENRCDFYSTFSVIEFGFQLLDEP